MRPAIIDQRNQDESPKRFLQGSPRGGAEMALICPLIEGKCAEAGCAWWTSTSLWIGAGQYETVSPCAVSKIADGIDGIASRG